VTVLGRVERILTDREFGAALAELRLWRVGITDHLPRHIEMLRVLRDEAERLIDSG
jgi:hypothetical protein